MNQPTPDLAGLQRRALLLAELAKRIRQEITTNKAHLETLMSPGQTNRPSVLIDGHKTQAGTVVFTDPETKPATWYESDPEAHIAFLDRLYPTEVEVITRPRQAFTSTYRINGDEVWAPDGEIVEGVTVVHPAPAPGHIAVTPAKDPAIAAELWNLIRSAPGELLGGADDE